MLFYVHFKAQNLNRTHFQETKHNHNPLDEGPPLPSARGASFGTAMHSLTLAPAFTPRTAPSAHSARHTSVQGAPGEGVFTILSFVLLASEQT